MVTLAPPQSCRIDHSLESAAMRSTLAVAAVFGLVLSSCASAGLASDTPSESQSPTPSGPATTPSASSAPQSPTASEKPAPTEGIAVVTVDGLRIRVQPAIEADEVPCERQPDRPVRLNSGETVWRTDAAPQQQDGYVWSEIVAATYACDELGLVVGWIASQADNGQNWLGVPGMDCYPPTTPFDLGRNRLTWLDCYSGQPLTFHAAYARLPKGIGFTCPGIEPSWLTCGIESLNDTGGSEFGFVIRIPPDVETPRRGEQVVVTGRLDDPLAQNCAEPAHRFAEVVVEMYCRTQFVIESMALDP